MILKTLKSIVLLALISYSVKAQDTTKTQSREKGINQVVEAACGQCKFDLPGKGCDLAVRINGKAYFVDGTGIDDHGDAHAKDGFCQSVRKAKVTGFLKDNRFKAKSFKLLPEKNTSQQ